MATAAEIQATAIATANAAIQATKNQLVLLNELAVVAASYPINDDLPVSSWLEMFQDFFMGLVGTMMQFRPGDISVSGTSGTAQMLPLVGPPNISLPAALNIPELTAVSPIITIPASPVLVFPPGPGNPPSFNPPAIPPKPQFTLPPVPNFSPIAIPEAPSIQIPVFSATPPPLDELLLPSISFEFDETIYTSELLEALRQKLLYDLQNGGYGIEPNDEEMLWDRARDREMRNAAAKQEEAMRVAAARGFAQPPGAAWAIMQEAMQLALEAASTLSRDIALKRSDLYVQNRQFTIEQSRQFEAMLIAYYGSVAERALNAAKAGAEIAIAVYNLRLARYNAQWESYKTMAMVYEIQVRAALAQIEVFKAEVEAAQVAAEVQKINAEMYRIQIMGIEALIKVYETEMQAAKLQAEIEGMKLEAFRTQVTAYVAQVQAKSAEFGAFESAVKGELAKVQVYQAQVSAYGSEVDAIKSKAQIDESIARTQVIAFEADLKRYASSVESYRTTVDASNNDIKNFLAAHELNLRSWNISADVQKALSELGQRILSANQAAHAKAIDQDLEIAKERFNRFVTELKAISDAYTEGAKGYTSIAESAMAQLVAIAQTT